MRAVRQGTIASLSERQREIVRLLAEGRSNKEIANLLLLTEGTVKQHLLRIFARLGVTNRTWAASLWHAAEGQGPSEAAAPEPAPPVTTSPVAGAHRVSVVAIAVARGGGFGMGRRCAQYQTLARNYGGDLLPSPPGLTLAVFSDAAQEAGDADLAVRFALGVLPLNADEAQVLRIGLARAPAELCGQDRDLDLAEAAQVAMRLALTAAPGTIVGCPAVQERLGAAAALLRIGDGGLSGENRSGLWTAAFSGRPDQPVVAPTPRRAPGGGLRQPAQPGWERSQSATGRLSGRRPFRSRHGLHALGVSSGSDTLPR